MASDRDWPECVRLWRELCAIGKADCVESTLRGCGYSSGKPAYAVAIDVLRALATAQPPEPSAEPCAHTNTATVADCRQCLDCGARCMNVWGDQPSAEPAAVCAAADVVAAVRAWCDEGGRSWSWHDAPKARRLLTLLRTATLRPEADVRAEERERCAKMVDKHADNFRMPQNIDMHNCLRCTASAIRTMGDESEDP